jgi:formiminotetrahydrofolate cyclodeaminase
VVGFGDRSLSQLLTELASEELLPGAGSAAATIVAMAAGLLAMAARRSRESWSDASGVAAQAEALRARGLELAGENADAYAEALAVLASPPGSRPVDRDAAIARALGRAAETPLAIAQAAADVGALGEAVVERCSREARGDAAAAVLLAEGAARAAAALVEINLTATPGDLRVERARRFADEASASARQVGRPE